MRDRFDGEPNPFRGGRVERQDDEWIVLPGKTAKPAKGKRKASKPTLDRFFTIEPERAKREAWWQR